jgi:hypothetical protein
MSRLHEDIITSRVRAALGDKYDPKADYRVVRPAMVGLPKYADCKEVGRFTEDSRAGGELVVLLRTPPTAPPPAPAKAASAAERVRSAIAAAKPRK